MTPAEARRRYTALEDQRRAGRLTPTQFATAVAELRFQDASGIWWQIDPATGGWLTWTDGRWAPTGGAPATSAAGHTCARCRATLRPDRPFCHQCGHPVSGAVRAPAGAASRPAAPTAAATPSRPRGQRWWDVLSLLGCTAVSALWYLYSGMAETQPDYRTCVAIIGLPLALIIFRPLIDRLLRPFQPLRRRVPRLVLLGIGLALPLLVSNLLYRTGTSQFEFMFRTVVISTLGSYVLLRNPAPAHPGRSPAEAAP